MAQLARLKESLDTSEAALAETRTARRTAESKASNLELRLEEVTTELKALVGVSHTCGPFPPQCSRFARPPLDSATDMT